MSTLIKTILHIHIVHYLINICIFIPKTVNSNRKVQCTWLVFLIKFLTLLIKKQQQKRKITAKILHNYNIHLGSVGIPFILLKTKNNKKNNKKVTVHWPVTVH